MEFYKDSVNGFLKSKLKLQLHKDKSKIFKLGNSINFLGFRVFYYHKLLKKSNIRKMKIFFSLLKEKYARGEIDYEKVYDCFEGGVTYAKNADTYNLRKGILAEFESEFPNEISMKEINRYLKRRQKDDILHKY